MVLFIPEGGLCNRMRAIASGYILATQANKNFEVEWYKSEDLNCEFKELFQTNELPFKVIEKSMLGWKQNWFKLKWLLDEHIKSHFGYTYISQKKINDYLEQPHMLYEVISKNKVIFRVNSKLVNAIGMFDIFRPNENLLHVINSYQNRLEKAVGVHIRRSDNTKAIENSPLSYFIEQMRLEIKKDPSTLFFLATDSNEVHDSLIYEFGDRVFQHSKSSYERNNPNAIKDAVIDLYCLSRTRKLIGSYWSSFTDSAWEISDIEHIIIKV